MAKAQNKHSDGFMTRYVSKKSAAKSGKSVFGTYMLLTLVKIRSVLRTQKADY